MGRPQSVTFRGKRWRVRYRAPKDAFGKCEHPAQVGKTIHMDPALAGQSRLYVAIHEGLHACYWDMDEEAICAAATDLANWLWRLGVRFDDEQEIDLGRVGAAIMKKLN